MAKRHIVKTLSLEGQKAAAIALLAEGNRTIRSIIKSVGISRTQFYQWRQEPGFAEMVEEAQMAYAKRYMKIGLANKDVRIMHLNRLHQGLLSVIEERADSPSMQRVPGGRTGLITKQYRVIPQGKGKPPRVVEEYRVDTGTISEIRDIQSDVAEELGQRTQKHELTGPDGQPLQPPQIVVNFVAVTRNNKDSQVLPEKQDGKALQASR